MSAQPAPTLQVRNQPNGGSEPTERSRSVYVSLFPPSSQGHRYKARKRDEKVKYDAVAFCDAIISNLNENEGNLEEISRYLDQAGSTLDYRFA